MILHNDVWCEWRNLVKRVKVSVPAKFAIHFFLSFAAILLMYWAPHSGQIETIFSPKDHTTVFVSPYARGPLECLFGGRNLAGAIRGRNWDMISAKDASDWSSTGGNFLGIHLRVLTVHYNINIKHTALSCLLRSTHTLTPRYLLKCVWYRQSAADTSLSLSATRSGCWMKCIALIIFNLRSCVGIFTDYGYYNTTILIFHLEPAPMHFTISMRGLSFLSFLFIGKVDFSFQ